ncbi:MAG: MarR family transcriptional regulator, partial [Candidatus Korarchaeota archaeon]|nr:MarR family transcriptional regulator [Candidatus Korarchaeota archaeon]
LYPKRAFIATLLLNGSSIGISISQLGASYGLIKLYACGPRYTIMGSGLRERVLKELSEAEVLHLRELLRRLNTSISTLKPVLAEMEEQGLVERFSHGGYTFYRITSEGRGFLMQIQSEAQQVKEGEGFEELGGKPEQTTSEKDEEGGNFNVYLS